MKLNVYLASLFFLILACQEPTSEEKQTSQFTDGATTQFSKIDAATSGISFVNTVVEDMELNFLNYAYLYAGAGIAVGDIDNDGLPDIYAVSNTGPNKLYKNEGKLSFKDITKSSHTEDYKGFSTGVTMLDVNNDGWLDIYVSKAASLKDDDARRNLLFVNQQNGTFKEDAAAWGIDDPGYTTQAYTLDYDRDGDLDLYVVNYRYDFKNNVKISGKIQRAIEEVTSDQLYRNDGTKFTKVTGEVGLYNKAWGLAAAVGDFNKDGWDDIYISNDFLEPDVLYINQQNGTFKNEINSRMKHISFNSMGSDLADLNNDLLPDLMTLDMLAENYARGKENMASMSTQNFLSMVEVGYHHAYMANMLHIDNGNGTYNETGQMSGVVKTDWSWAPLIADYDNDGNKDIYITNGVIKDYTNQDFRTYLREKEAKNESAVLEDLLALMPSQKLDNYMYKNKGDITFSNETNNWGLSDPSFSSGGAYADLDNDGDLDLVVNNTEDLLAIYRNNQNKNYLQVKLNGAAKNKLGIGSKVYLTTEKGTQLQQLYLTRGYQSSMPEIVHFGLGDASKIEKVTVVWPDGKTSVIPDVSVNERITIDYASATNERVAFQQEIPLKKSTDSEALGLDYQHQENDYNDYAAQLLIPQKQSTKGTGIVKGDVNGDGLDDLFVGNALGEAAALYIQNNSGKFKKTNESLWNQEAKYEDANALFFDADSDKDLDLYVVSAGYELSENNPLLQDRLYLNDGKGNFSKNNRALPKMLTSGKAIAAADYDSDGDLDLFVGGNVIPGKYPLAPRSYLLKNDGGTFTDMSSENTDLSEPGMISEVLFTDYDSDGDLDLLAVGEWMNPTIFSNHKGHFTKETISGFEKNEGWWFSATQGDFDGDGDMDYVFGNVGKNNKFQPKEEKPIFIYAQDFDKNGTFDVALSKINEGKRVPVRGKQCSSEQNPFLLEKIETYKEFASLDMNAIYGEDKLNDAYQLVAHHFETMYAENNGDGTFKITKLPNEAQLGPTMSIIAKDLNKDGFMDIMGIGAIYDAEVETIRYDSNFGYVLLGNGKGEFTYAKQFDPMIVSDAKDMTEITINGESQFIVVSNNSPLEVFSLKP